MICYIEVSFIDGVLLYRGVVLGMCDCILLTLYYGIQSMVENVLVKLCHFVSRSKYVVHVVI